MSTILELLTGVYDVKEPDPVLLGVIGDRLEEMGRLDLKWILAGACVHCGGELYYPKQRGTDGRWRKEVSLHAACVNTDLTGMSEEPRCRVCNEEDVEVTPWRGSWINRTVRMLGMKPCGGGGHCRPKRIFRSAVHHIDGDPTNNDSINLIPVTIDRTLTGIWEHNRTCPKCDGLGLVYREQRSKK